MEVDLRRIRALNTIDYAGGPVLYWMSRDMRVHDNWALLYAQQVAREHNVPFGVVYNLKSEYIGGGERQFAWKIAALNELAKAMQEKNIPFAVLHGDTAEKEIASLVQKHSVGMVITDYCPLRINRNWIATMQHTINVPFVEVDTHNIVPVWVASDKQEFAAYTIRKKIHTRLGEFLTDFPRVQVQKKRWPHKFPTQSWRAIKQQATFSHDVPPVDWLLPGENAAKRTMKRFFEDTLPRYAEARNDPNANALSNVSPYLHYGNISAQRVAHDAQRYDASIKSQEAFLEELIVRRELSDNFCEYNKHYDVFEGLPDWAQQTLNAHRGDPREYTYSMRQWERAQTHDELWNAAQREMVETGKMHGYMRMYWAKKILEWTKDPETALRIAITLNDRYELDGRDPNGYVGVMWSIGGVHDRAWPEREVYGKIRYMNANGCKRKFAVDAYIAKWGAQQKLI